MRAWRVHEHGRPADVLRLEGGLPEPEPGPGQVRVVVEACALNFADSLLCDGTYQEHPPLPFTPGMEVCGRIDAVGEGVDAGSRPLGARVVALTALPHGGLATHALAAAHDVFDVPEAMGAAEAAALPVTYQTGWLALHHRGHLQPGETVLVHAGAGGVGSAAIELAFQSNSKARYPLARDKVMTLVAYTYALRVSELVNLHLYNFQPDKRYPQFKQFASVDLIGKGDYEGSTHALDPSIVEVMEWYLEYIRPAFQDQDTEDLDLVFYSQQGGPVTDEQFRRRLLDIGQQAGIKKRVTPHMLRRTNATDSMDLLGPVGTQKNIRHKNVATTYDSYYRPDPNDYGRDLSNAIGKVAALRGRKPPEDKT